MMYFTQEEFELMTRIRSSKRFPVAQLRLRSTKEPTLYSVALRNVSLTTPDDTMEQIQRTASLLADLARKGMVKICYRLPVSARSDFQIFYDSAVFRQLCEMAAEGAGRSGFLFDSADIKRGVVTVTARGRECYFA